MENDILDALDDLCYPGGVDEAALSKAVNDGPKSLDYARIVSWLATELATTCSLSETVSAISDENESGTFLMELSGFLREYGCVYKLLTEGPVNERLDTRQAKIQLLDYLLGEVAACRVLKVKKPEILKPTTDTSTTQDTTENGVSTELKKMLIALKFPKPPTSITPFQIFSKVEVKIKELLATAPADHLGKPLLKCRLSDTQWEKLHKINLALAQEYEGRREMLLKRLDCTIQSFLWSDRTKNKQDQVARVYQPIRNGMTKHSQLSIAQILAAREDLVRLQKTSSGELRRDTKCDINKVMIGKVPDRGGRAWEQEPPPPEMPGFQQRQASSGRGGRGGYGDRGGHGDRGGGRGGGGRGGYSDRGGGGGGGGGYDRGGSGRGGYDRGGSAGDQRGGQGHVQGGWSDPRSQHSQNVGGNWGRGGGGYQGGGSGGGGYQGGGGHQSGGGGGYQGGGQQGGYNQGGGGGRGGYRGRGGGNRY